MDYLDKERFFFEDREVETQKMWLIIENGEIIYSSLYYEDVFTAAKRIETARKIQVGWVDEADFYSGDFEYIYNLLNTIRI